jgi:archaellum biogenesis ATPase FlaH
MRFKNGKVMREIYYIVGKSGSGKSYFMSQYAKQYRKTFPKNDIYILSQITDDDNLKEIKGLYSIDVDESLIVNPLNYLQFEKSLLLIDDIDAIANEEIKQKIKQLVQEIAELGRHKEISLCVTSHLSTKGHETKTIINEATSFVLFRGGSNKRLLTEYLHFSEKDIKKLFKTFRGRWICFNQENPEIIIGSKTVMSREHFDDIKA